MSELAGSGNLTTSSTVQTVMANRFGKRIAFNITNYGGTIAWVNPSDKQVAAVGTGIPIYPGGNFGGSRDGGGNCYQGAITAVDDGAAGATTISYWERVE